jgi:hypothetical protein
MLRRMLTSICDTLASAPSQVDERAAWAAPLPLEDFAAWLVEIDRTTGVSSTELWKLYGEHCLCTESEPLTKGQFDRRKRAAGIERYRESIGERRWLYSVRGDSNTDRIPHKEAQLLERGADVISLANLRKAS